MKKLFVIAAAAFMTFSLSSAFAQTEKSGKEEKCCKTEVVCNADKKCDKKDCKQGDCKKSKDCKNAKQCCKAGKGNKGQKGHGMKGEGRNGKKMHKGDRAFEGVNLSEQQKTKVAELRENVRKDVKVAKADMKEKEVAARAKFDEGLKNILTKDQYAKYTENLQKKPCRENAAFEKNGKKCKADCDRKDGKKHDGKRFEQKKDTALSGFKKGPEPKMVTNS